MLLRSFQGVTIARPVTLGIILNKNARYFSQGDGGTSIISTLGDHRVYCTDSIAQIPEALEYLIKVQKATVIGICGGDGTIHHVINALIHYWRTEQNHLNRSSAPPPILLLRGGTLNILARAIRIEGNPTRLLRRFLRRFDRKMISQLPLTGIHLLSVQSQKQPPRYGFVFGSEITAHCLELYEREFGAGYGGLLRFLWAAVSAFVLKNKLWQNYKYMIEHPKCFATIDTQSANAMALVASTIDIKLLAGLISGLEVNDYLTGAMKVRILTPQSAGQLMRNLPNLVLGRCAEGILDFESVRSINLTNGKGFSLDGEVFWESSEDVQLEISSPKWTLPFVAPFP
jgi:diacylglycerol kinase family enzyme